MSGINGVGSNSPVQKIVANPIHKSVPADASKQMGATDKVELSGMSHLLKALKDNDVRTEKVAAIKAQIEAGTYEDDAKMNAAVDRMLDDVLK
ncbi:MAG: flagellar biosynthesis anti-sigma factor FlgM [Tepidisphaeraceae bacterium]